MKLTNTTQAQDNALTEAKEFDPLETTLSDIQDLITFAITVAEELDDDISEKNDKIKELEDQVEQLKEDAESWKRQQDNF